MVKIFIDYRRENHSFKFFRIMMMINWSKNFEKIKIVVHGEFYICRDFKIFKY